MRGNSLLPSGEGLGMRAFDIFSARLTMLPPELTAKILAASEKMSGVVMGFSEN